MDPTTETGSGKKRKCIRRKIDYSELVERASEEIQFKKATPSKISNCSIDSAISTIISKWGANVGLDVLACIRYIPFGTPYKIFSPLLPSGLPQQLNEWVESVSCKDSFSPLWLSEDSAEAFVLIPPTLKCFHCDSILEPHNKSVDVRVVSSAGVKMLKKQSFRCRKCSNIYNYSQYGNKERGLVFYPKERPLVEGNDSFFIERNTYAHFITLINHGFVSFEAYTESMNDAFNYGEDGRPERLDRRQISSCFYRGEVERELRTRKLIHCTFFPDDAEYEKVMDRLNGIRKEELYPHGDCNDLCQKKGCGRLWVADGIWKLVFPHCMFVQKNVVEGVVLANFPEVCPESLVPVIDLKMEFEERNNSVGKFVNELFEWQLNFTLELKYIVTGTENGLLCFCPPSHPCQVFEVFIPNAIQANPKELQALLSQQSPVPLRVKMKSEPLADYFHNLVEGFLRGANAVTIKSTTSAGEQPDGTFVFSNTIQIDFKGDHLLIPKYYLNSNTAPIQIEVPLSDRRGKKLYKKLKMVLPMDTYMNGLFVGGAIFMNFAYSLILEKMDHVPLVVISGHANTGKTLLAKTALSLYGMHQTGMYRHVSQAKEKLLLSQSTLPYVWNDVDCAQTICQTAGLVFEDGYSSNQRNTVAVKTAPTVTCNTYVVDKIPNDHNFKEWSRICLIPIEDPIQMERVDLKSYFSKASKSIGELIRLRNSLGTEEVQKISQKIRPQLPNTCGNRLASNYAILLHCTDLFASIVDPEPEARPLIESHFEDNVVPKVTKYYSSEEDVDLGGVFTKISTLLVDREKVHKPPVARILFNIVTNPRL